jgi:hypothetical protein
VYARGWAANSINARVRLAAENDRLHGANALLQLHEPVNKFPDFVRYIVQRLKTVNTPPAKAGGFGLRLKAGLIGCAWRNANYRLNTGT